MTVGRVTDVFLSRVRQQVAEHKIVVLFDGGKVFSDAIGLLPKSETPVERWDGCFFELRYRLEPYLRETEPRAVVVYLPLEEAEGRAPLAEVLAAGVVMRPGQQPPARNTRLSILARHAFAGVLPDSKIEPLIKEIESGNLTLAELDTIAEKGTDSLVGTLGLLFGTSNVQEIALLFLSDRGRDAEIEKKAVRKDLAALFLAEVGADLPDVPSCKDLADRLARYLLATEFVTSTGEDRPKAWGSVPVATKPEQRDRCLHLMKTWRSRTDLRGAYVEYADRIEGELGLNGAQKAKGDTFRVSEFHLLESVERGLLDDPSHDLVGVAERRIGAFWPSIAPELMDRWALVASAGRVLLHADRLEAEMKTGASDVRELAIRYTGHGKDAPEVPWCLLDTFHRHMERRVYTFDFDVKGGHATLEKLIAKARGRYTRVAGSLAGHFLRDLNSASFKVKGFPPQATVFKRFVEPAREKGKCAYLLVDALRWEMARELVQDLPAEYQKELEPALGTLPSITEIGMAAVLPRADQGAVLVSAPGGRLGLEIAGKTLAHRKQRLEFLAATIGGKTHATKLEALLPPAKKEKESIAAADFIVITATDELDGLCEQGNVPMARRMMDDVLLQVRRGLRILFDLGVDVVVVTSDHGFLFGESLDSGQLIDPPGGQTIDISRRVWIGKGGAGSESFLRLKASSIGLGGDFEIAVPWSLGGFKTAGISRAYFHGGASPQELLLPVLTVRRERVPAAGGELNWTLIPGSKSLSTRFLSVQMSATPSGLFQPVPPLVRLEVREGKNVISRVVSASYGFQEATGFVQLALAESGDVKPGTVTLMIDPESKGKSVEIVLFDAATDRELTRLSSFPVSMVGF